MIDNELSEVSGFQNDSDDEKGMIEISGANDLMRTLWVW